MDRRTARKERNKAAARERRNAPALTQLEVMMPDGSTKQIEAVFSECQAAVGGYVEPVWLPNGDCLLVNEEGLIQGLDFNPGASLMTIDRIVGPAVYIPKRLIKSVLY